jgi:hypothetical protein
MRKIHVLLAVSFVALLMASCTTFKTSGIATLPKGQTYTSLGTFHTTVWVSQFLGSSGGSKLFNITADTTEGPVFDAIQREVEKLGGSAAVNITIENKPSWGALLLNGATFGLYAPTVVYISGTVIK